MDYDQILQKLVENVETKDIFNQDQMKSISQSVDERIKTLVNPENNQEVSELFGQQIKLVPGMNLKDVAVMSIGAATSGAVGNLVARFVPGGLTFGITGIPSILGGIGLRRFVLKKGIGAMYANGVVIGGVASALTGFGLTAQVESLISGFGGAVPGGSPAAVTSGSAPTPQTAVLRGTVENEGVPAGFTE